MSKLQFVSIVSQEDLRLRTADTTRRCLIQAIFILVHPMSFIAHKTTGHALFPLDRSPPISVPVTSRLDAPEDPSSWPLRPALTGLSTPCAAGHSCHLIHFSIQTKPFNSIAKPFGAAFPFLGCDVPFSRGTGSFVSCYAGN